MPKKVYPPDLEPWIREKFKTYTAQQISSMVKKEWNIDMTSSQVHAYTQNHRIHYGRKGKKKPEKKITTPEIDAFIYEHYKGTGYLEMANLVNERFGTSYTVAQIANYYNRNHLNSGRTGQFEKGHVPSTKGKKWDEFMSPESQDASRKTQFKKGHIPHNGGTPVGELRIRSSHGYKHYWEKTAQPNVWRMKHIVEWEKINGKVPKGYIICFADGDTLNWHIENLILTSQAQNAVKNRWGIKGHDMETAKTANLIADLKIVTNRARKKIKRK